MAAKPFYADYVNRLMRWYCRAKEEGKEVNLERALDRENWEAVAKVMEGLDEEDMCYNEVISGYHETMCIDRVELGWEQDRLGVD